MRFAGEATPRLLWFNFAHLLSISLLPFSTAWMAVSKLAPQSVSFYAAVFFLVNATYIALIWELIGTGDEITARTRKVMRIRSVSTLCLFGVAAIAGAEISDRGAQHLYMLFGRISKARSSPRTGLRIELNLQVRDPLQDFTAARKSGYSSSTMATSGRSAGPAPECLEGLGALPTDHASGLSLVEMAETA